MHGNSKALPVRHGKVKAKPAAYITRNRDLYPAPDLCPESGRLHGNSGRHSTAAGRAGCSFQLPESKKQLAPDPGVGGGVTDLRR